MIEYKLWWLSQDQNSEQAEAQDQFIHKKKQYFHDMLHLVASKYDVVNMNPGQGLQ